ncbi:MAG: alpha/beta hydrolase [Pseudomonadota bacterium]|nr:alpha/beta hydrolase [Pseudomonadota bacterium]MEC9414592.1 alpha/beta hydrolase [Pseudomonadota bacterium]
MSSEENKIVIEHMNKTVEKFYSIEDERLGMKHFRYVMDDYFSADKSIKCCGNVSSVSADGVYALWVTTKDSDPNKRILYFHGGGYVIGSVRGYLPLASHLSKATGASVLLIDYSLSPENIFPAAVDDAKKAYNWMLDNGPEGEKRYEKAFISGDSAGGGLSVATTLAIKDDNGILPNAIMPISPWVEMDPVSQSYEDNKDIDPFVSKDGIAWFSSVYVPDESDRNNPYASPLYGDFKNFPPMLIQVGTREVLLDDSKKLNEKAKSEGCDVELQIWDDMVHIFQGFAPYLPEANEALESISKFISDK